MAAEAPYGGGRHPATTTATAPLGQNPIRFLTAIKVAAASQIGLHSLIRHRRPFRP